MPVQKQNKRKAIIGTFLFHTLLLFCFVFLGLSYTIPPPPEEGITINFGFDNFGLGNNQPKEIIEKLQPESTSVEEANTKEHNEITIQNSEDAPTIPEKTKQKKDIPTKKIELEKEPDLKLNERSLYTGKKENLSKSEGRNSEKGDQGSQDGDPNTNIHTVSGVGSNGITFNLGGRTISELKKPIYKSQSQGTVVVTIRVNRYGKVINAIPGAKGSTTTNSYLYRQAKEAALKTTFDPKTNAPEIQIGTIIYNFRLQ